LANALPKAGFIALRGKGRIITGQKELQNKEAAAIIREVIPQNFLFAFAEQRRKTN
jgi:hypothetical protein